MFPQADRFRGLDDFASCMNGARMTTNGFDSNGDLVVDRANDPNTVFAVQQALADLGYPIAATLTYDDATAATVRQFKYDQNIAIPAGLAQHDGVTGPGTSRRLDQLFADNNPQPVEDPQVRYTEMKSKYTNIAFAKANGNAHTDWLPESGFAVNRPRIVDVYKYYRALALGNPDLFLWAGLGYMAGGAIVGGLDLDPGVADQVIMVRIGRDIFYDLAWQHEAYLDAPGSILELADLHDRFNEYARYDSLGVVTYENRTPSTSYRAAWEKITSGQPDLVAQGNFDLLRNEQWSIVQPHYDYIKPLTFTGLIGSSTVAITPYHRDFIVELPTGDILQAPDRWAWISGGMWTNWVKAGATERTRLISLPFDDVCMHEYGTPGRPDLLPPGGP